MAALLAGSGYVVAVLEVYHDLESAGTILPYDTVSANRGNAHKIAKEVASYDADARVALDYLQTDPHCTWLVLWAFASVVLWLSVLP